MTDFVVSAGAAARATSHVAAPDGHAPLYETCAALIVAVMVVIYFDERVRNSLTARMRGYAIGSLGGIIGTGLLIPLFALAGFISDTVATRVGVVGYTLVFFVVAFGAAMQIWGTEDGRRLRTAHPAPPLPPPIPLPRGGQTERERVGEVLGAMLANLAQMHPAVIAANTARTGQGPEAERLRNVTGQMMTLNPYLIAVRASYPSAEVREHLARFTKAASRAMDQAAIPFADEQILASDQAKEEWQTQASAAFDAMESEYDAVILALHPEDAGPSSGPAHTLVCAPKPRHTQVCPPQAITARPMAGNAKKDGKSRAAARQKGRKVTDTVQESGDPDLAGVVRACEERLKPSAEWKPFEGYPGSLALCVLDAIWSVNARYPITRGVIQRYRNQRRWQGNPDEDGPSGASLGL